MAEITTFYSQPPLNLTDCLRRIKFKVKEVEFESILDKFGHDRLRIRLKIEKGKLIDVVCQYEAYIEKKWTPIVRYDCSHGFFHRDILKPNGDTEKQEIVIDNLKSASKYAEQDLKDRWEWYKERYIKKMKRPIQ